MLTGLAYPVGDLLLLGMIIAIFGLSSWRPGRAWLVLGLGLALNAVGDAIYLVQTADGTWQDGCWVERALARLVAAGRTGRLAADQARQRPARTTACGW